MGNTIKGYGKNYARLTYKTTGDATREPHYCAAPGVKKDDLLQRLGKYEDLGLSPERLYDIIDNLPVSGQAFSPD